MNPVHVLSSRFYNIHLISSHASLVLPSFSFRFPTKPSARFYYFPYVTLILQNFRPCFNHSNIIGEHLESWSFSLCNAPRPPVTSSFLGTYRANCLSTCISNTLNLCSYLHVRDTILHSYKTGDKITRLYILGNKQVNLVWIVLTLKNYVGRRFSMFMYKYCVKYLYNLTTKKCRWICLKFCLRKIIN